MTSQSHNSFDAKLPYGHELKNLLVQPYFTEASLRQLLQKEGVFYNRKDKKYTIPILSSMLLTPSEYEFIKEQVKDKEENFKYRSSQWCWQSQKKLFDELPKDLIV